MTPEIIKALRADGYTHIVPVNDRRYACVVPFLYTHAIIIGRWTDRGGYDDRWCYESHEHAKAALVNWSLTAFEGEPQGWHRHPVSGRRRPEGDAQQERIMR
jgi:hypothetical protein